MKKQVSMLLLLCYGLVLFQPLFPVVSDCIAHIFFESSHVATVHYENGSYHMHIEVKAASEEAQKNNVPIEKAQKTAHSFHTVASSPLLQNLFKETIVLVTIEQVGNLHDGYSILPSPPPWVLA